MKQPKNLLSLLLFSLLLLSVIETRAQNPIPNATLNVTVLDGKKRPAGLSQHSDLQIYEDKKPQAILSFDKDDRPINYGLLLDSTGSLRRQFPMVLSLAQQVIDQSQANDTGFLMRFIDINNIQMLVDLTSDKAQLRSGLASIAPMGGQTDIYDAIYSGIETLVKAKAGQDKRSVLVLISDGENRISRHTLDELRDLIKRTEVQIYVFALTSELSNESGFIRQSSRASATDFIDELATLSGGRAFYIKRGVDVAPSIEAFSQILRNQYLVAYRSESNGSNPFKRVEVKVANGPDKSKRSVVVRRYRYAGDTRPN